MRTAILSIAALASGVLAAPSWEGRNWAEKNWAKQGGDSWGSDSWGASSSSSASSSSVATSPVSESSSTSVVRSFTAGSVTFSHAKNSTSSVGHASIGSAPIKSTPTGDSTTYTTKIVTTFTTVCPATSTYITSGSTATTTFITTSTVTSSYTATIVTSKSTPVSGPSSSSKAIESPSKSTPVSPESFSSVPVQTTVTDVTTAYTTVCPATTTEVHGSTTLTSTYLTTSTVTTVVRKTLTVTAVPAGPTGSGSASSPASPVTTSPSGHGPDDEVEHVTVTQVTSVLTTICPETTTFVKDSTTITGTYQATSTVTSVIKSRVTLTRTAVSDSESTPLAWSTVQWGTQLLSYAISEEITFPTSTATTFVGPASYTRVPSSSTTAEGDSEGSSPSQSKKHSHGHSHSTKAGSQGTGVSTKSTAVLTGSGSQSSASSKSTAAPTGSDSHSSSSSKSTSVSTKSAPSGSVSSKSVLPSGTGSKSSTRPAVTGTGSVSKPAVTGTGSVTKTSSTSVSTSSSKPSESCVPCQGQPGNDPLKWCGYTINDNSYKVMPKTCRTVEYDFVITNTTFAPDGVSRLGLLVNGQMPGPKIEANWGDTVIVRVHNQLQDNGTAIHFHGQRQNHTNEMDGVPSITQCPLAPGQVQTYEFKADNYGTSWWHSHFALQIYDGVFGPMVVHGPASAEYDAEEFVVLQDWNHIPVDVLYGPSELVQGGGPSTLDTGLINGKNVFGSSGSRYTLNVESGKTYRLRLLNSAIQTAFKFYLDGHKFKVIANDYVPIKPYETTIVNIHPGQRYDVIFKADQPVGNYWLRADGQQTCTQLKNSKDIRGIVSYKGAASGSPTSTAYTYTEECVEEPLASLVPVKTIAAGSQEQNIHETVVIGANGGTPNLFKWTLSGTTFQSQYGDPTLVSVYNNGSIPDYSGNLAIEVPKLGEWVYVIIESPIPLPHPIHLHGHDFLVLAQGYGAYSASVPLNTATPARRDSALLPGARGQGGYLVIAFEADNPGAWLMHCHIGWHSAMGFALQIIEGVDSIAETVKHGDSLNEICTNWSSYATETGLIVHDSGI